jgi:glycosyltransferase involved in cell wall biosynthesis
MRTGRARILVPSGPLEWGSHPAIRAAWLAALRGLKLEVREVPTGRTPSRTEARELAAGCDVWILPYGAAGQGGLRHVAECRRHLGSSGPRLIAMLNGEGARGAAYLHSSPGSVRGGDLLVVPGRAEERLLRSFLPEFAGMRTVPFAVGPGWVLDRPRRRPARPRVFLYAGRLSWQKNVDLLIDAFVPVARDDRGVRLLIAGAVDSLGYPHLGVVPAVSYAAHLAKVIARRRLEGRVEFLGPLGPERLRAAFDEADAQVSLSTHFGEEFGYSVAQGLARGVPALLTAWGGHLDLIDEGAARPVPVRSRPGLGILLPDASAAALALRERFAGYAARSPAAHRPEAVARAWRDLIDEATHSPSDGSDLALDPQVSRHWARPPHPAFRPQDPLLRRILRAYAGRRA